MSLAKRSRSPLDEMEHARVKRSSVTANDAVSWQARMRTAFFEGVTEDDMREIVQGLVKKAKSGDMSAIRMLLSYGIGSPNVNIKNAVVVQGHQQELAPLPTAPCQVLPATTDKVDTLAMRAANGQPLFDPRDSRRDLS